MPVAGTPSGAAHFERGAFGHERSSVGCHPRLLGRVSPRLVGLIRERSAVPYNDLMAETEAATPDIHVPDDWYARSFGELYPLLYRHRDDASAAAEVEAFARLLELEPHARVLDICCGGGRHMAAMRTRGLDVRGVDLSEPLLHAAGQRPGLRGRIVRGDLRALPFAPASFDAAVNLFTSFGYFLDEAENRLALAQMARVLRPGGRLLVDVMHAAHLRRTLEPFSRRTVGELIVENRRRLTGRRVVNRMRVRDGNEQVIYTESVRLYEPEEFVAMFQQAGLKDVQLFGSFAGDPLGPDAPRMIGIGVRQ